VLIGLTGYSVAFALLALAPAVAIPLVPQDQPLDAAEQPT
jgi:hypothetical protein